MEIIIGRETGARRLHCAVNGKDFYIGTAGSVPQSVSRVHCKIIVNANNMSIENTNVNNVTWVDNMQVVNKKITENSKIYLGSERYSLPLTHILNLILPLNPLPSASLTYSLLKLKDVWTEYDECKMNILDNASKQANKQRLQGILSMLGMCMGFVPGLGSIRSIIIIIALLLSIYFFYKGNATDSLQRQLHNLDEKFAYKYKCPNPKCNRSFGNLPYRNIEYMRSCPACGCKYTH